MRPLRFLLLAIVIATALMPIPARACQCLESPWIDVLMAEVPVILRARVVEVGEASDLTSPVRVVLEVQAYWRDSTGAFAPRVEVWDAGPIACSSGLHQASVGQEWFVLAEPSNGQLRTDECLRTTTWGHAMLDYAPWIGAPLVVENDAPGWGTVKALYRGE